MSLRLRLLLAVGAVALTALAIADVVTDTAGLGKLTVRTRLHYARKEFYARASAHPAFAERHPPIFSGRSWPSPAFGPSY